MNFQQILAISMSALLACPAPIWAETNVTVAALGSVASTGEVYSNEASVPAQSTLFAGDHLRTQRGAAVIQYRAGARVLLARNSEAEFAPALVRLRKGHMTFRSAAEGGLTLDARGLRLEPAGPGATGEIGFKDDTIQVALTAGTLRAVDPSGTELASLKAGETAVFGMAQSGIPQVPGTVAPQAFIGGTTFLLLALAAGAVATPVIVYDIVQDNDEDQVASPVR
jgi:hypothetical protein